MIFNVTLSVYDQRIFGCTWLVNLNLTISFFMKLPSMGYTNSLSRYTNALDHTPSFISPLKPLLEINLELTFLKLIYSQNNDNLYFI